jgi:hypothetical protein
MAEQREANPFYAGIFQILFCLYTKVFNKSVEKKFELENSD